MPPVQASLGAPLPCGRVGFLWIRALSINRRPSAPRKERLVQATIAQQLRRRKRFRML
jgi:hypothetical protein